MLIAQGGKILGMWEASSNKSIGLTLLGMGGGHFQAPLTKTINATNFDE